MASKRGLLGGGRAQVLSQPDCWHFRLLAHGRPQASSAMLSMVACAPHAQQAGMSWVQPAHSVELSPEPPGSLHRPLLARVPSHPIHLPMDPCQSPRPAGASSAVGSLAPPLAPSRAQHLAQPPPYTSPPRLSPCFGGIEFAPS